MNNTITIVGYVGQNPHAISFGDTGNKVVKFSVAVKEFSTNTDANKTPWLDVDAWKGDKDRIVPFPEQFKEVLALHSKHIKAKGATYLFESSWKKRYTDRGIRKILERYADAAGLSKSMSPHKLRHFLFTWLKKQAIDDALIQPYSGHASRKSLEVYSQLSLTDAQTEYNQAIRRFPV